MRDFADEGRTESLQALIEKTEQIIAGYEEAEDQAESKLCVADTNTTLSCSTLLVAVADAIAIFETANYKLSAELLTQSFHNTDSTMVWGPEYGG